MKTAISALFYSTLLLQIYATPGGSSKQQNDEDELTPLIPSGQMRSDDDQRYISCKKPQIDTIKASLKAASKMMDAAEIRLNKSPPSSLYTVYFGKYNEGRHKFIKDRFVAMKSVADITMRYDCEYYAGARKSKEPHEHAFFVRTERILRLSPKFWEASLKTQAGKIIQEFSKVGHDGAGYFSSNEKDTKQLAKADPEKAVKNALSYMYFAQGA